MVSNAERGRDGRDIWSKRLPSSRFDLDGAALRVESVSPKRHFRPHCRERRWQSAWFGFNGAGRNERIGNTERMNPSPNTASVDAAEIKAKRSRARRLMRFSLLVSGVLTGILLAVFAGLQFGAFDSLFAGRAQSALATIAGPETIVEVDRASVRVGRDGRIAIEADSVSVQRSPLALREPAASGARDDAFGEALSSVEAVRLLLDPMPLLRGEIKVVEVEISGVVLDATMLAGGPATDWSALRVDSLEPLTESAFAALDRALQLLQRSRTRSILLTNAKLANTGTVDAPRIEELQLALSDRENVTLSGSFMVGGQTIALDGQALRHERADTLEQILVRLTGLHTFGNEAFTNSLDDEPIERQRQRFGVESETDISLSARRTPRPDQPMLKAQVSFSEGDLTLGGIVSPLRESRLGLGYFKEQGKIEVLPSRMTVADTTIPFSGGLVDLSRLGDDAAAGIAAELVVDQAMFDPTDTEFAALAVDGKISARFLGADRKLIFDEIALDTGPGTVVASAAIEFGASSPAISLAGAFDQLDTASLKQLWPHWVAVRPRQWVIDNVVGGIGSNGQIRLYIPAGRMAEQPGRLDLDENQLQISMRVSGPRVHVAGDIPPLRDTQANVVFRGRALEVDIEAATAYFPSGRTVAVENGTFAIRRTDLRPLMADMDLQLAGGADAMAELISYRPIAVLDRVGYQPEDLSGSIDAHVQARFGLIRDQDPPVPAYDVKMALTDVAVSKPVEGRMLSAVNGNLSVDPQKAVLEGKATIDGAPLDITVTRPLDPDAGITAGRKISGTIGDRERAELLPGLSGLLAGPITLTMEQTGPGQDKVEIDLSSARLIPPAIGWQKEPGARASVSLTMRARDDGLDLNDIVLTGDGIAARGSARLTAGQLATLDLSNVRLSTSDDFDVSIARASGGAFDIDVRGRSFDARPLIRKLRAGSEGGSGAGGGGSQQVSVSADVAQVLGFDGEVLSGVSVRYSGRGSRPTGVDLKAVTGSGEAAVLTFAETDGIGRANLTAGDAGALARFADLYRRVSAGRIEVALQRSGDGPFRGNVRIADFAVINENHLKELVTARASGAPGRVSDAIQSSVDVNSMRFERGYTDIEISNGTVGVANGVLRGQEIGLSFQGVVRDAGGNMAVTGTFMPAYGLNRLFAEIPLFGALLGNGRDRGLIGITFRLDGQVSAPQLTVNPISAIAPGVFRQIFEF
ncbi:DUF3971 domain-containing protein [Georhizobium sp. MAB10]|uniref:YhdP family protein n=1 Tax=Georhizobium sp. MAB10 TaxID=3028319 RepID=UPI003855FFC0